MGSARDPDETLTTAGFALQVAILTPPGRAAIATIAIWGPGAETAVSKRYESVAGNPISCASFGRIVFGRWRHQADHFADEEIVVVRKSKDVLEVHCHGGDIAVNSIVESLKELGATKRDSDDWFQTSTKCEIEAAAASQLIRTESETTATILLDQWKGALRRELEYCVEACGRGSCQVAERRLQQLARFGPLGTHLTVPWRVVAAGAPNVGKSSLVNRLLGYERSITHDRPGTTRDRIATPTMLNGWPFLLTDTAGLRRTADSVESTGVDLAIAAVENADLVLWVHDVTSAPPQQPTNIRTNAPVVKVANKVDLVKVERLDLVNWVATSAKSGYGLDTLKQVILAELIPQIPSPGAGIPFTFEQCTTIQRALDAFSRQEHKVAVGQLQSLLN